MSTSALQLVPGVEMRQLRSFVTVADAPSLRQAARRLHVAQSALGRTIRDLERELGVPLLVRSRHGIRLTAIGERFLVGARRTLAEANAAIARARDARTSAAGPLVIASVNPELRAGWIGTALRRYREVMPRVAVHLVSMASIAMSEAAAVGAIDVGIGYTLAPGHGVRITTLMHDRLAGVIVARTHPLARRRRVSVFDMAPYPFLWCDRRVHPTIFDRIFAAFARVGFTPDLVPGVGQLDANSSPLFTLVGNSTGWALCGSGGRAALPANLRYVPLSDIQIPIEIDLVTRADDESVRTRRFRGIVQALGEPGDSQTVSPDPPVQL